MLISTVFAKTTGYSLRVRNSPTHGRTEMETRSTQITFGRSTLLRFLTPGKSGKVRVGSVIHVRGTATGGILVEMIVDEVDEMRDAMTVTVTEGLEVIGGMIDPEEVMTSPSK
jgi:hypothetical protein